MKKLSLSKETLRDLTARPMSHEEVTMVGGGRGLPRDPDNPPPASMYPPCGTGGYSIVGGLSCHCIGSVTGCAGSTSGCNSTTDHCAEK